MTELTLSRRERKKQQTRAQILDASKQLFTEQGYDATTLEQVATAVDISVPTLVAYFPSKERLALAGVWDAFDDLRHQLEDPDRLDDTLTIWRAWVTETAAWTVKNRRTQLNWLKIEADTPALVRGRLALLQAWEDLLAESIAIDRGTDPDRDLPTRLTATMLAFGYRAVVHQWRASGATGDLVATANEVIDIAARQLDEAPLGGRRPVRAR